MSKSKNSTLTPAMKSRIERGFEGLNKRPMSQKDLSEMKIAEARLYVAESHRLDKKQAPVPNVGTSSDTSMQSVGLDKTSKQPWSKGKKVVIFGSILAVIGILSHGNADKQAVTTNKPAETKIVTPAASKSESPAQTLSTEAPVTSPEPAPVPVVAPEPAPTPTPMPAASPTPAAKSNCDPNYSGGCVPYVNYDLDCPDIGFQVRVIGTDHYRLDADKDGIGCESY